MKKEMKQKINKHNHVEKEPRKKNMLKMHSPAKYRKKTIER